MYFLVYIKHVYTVFVYHLSIDIMLRKPLQDVTETVLTIIVLTERMLAEWGVLRTMLTGPGLLTNDFFRRKQTGLASVSTI